MKNYKELKIEIFLLLIAFLFSIISLIISNYKSDYMWFARSGSIIVLCAVIVEFRLHNTQLKKIFKRIKQAGIANFAFNASLSNEHKYIGRLAHIFIISGTLIWGYGDLIDRLMNIF